MNVLFALSPVLSGAYRSAHTLTLDGQPVSDLRTWRAGAEIVITNPLPYSRLIEGGGMTMRVPGTDHVYQQAEAIVRRGHSKLARVRFGYRSMSLPYIGLGGRSGGRTASAAKRSAYAMEREARLPCLVITEPGRGER